MSKVSAAVERKMIRDVARRYKKRGFSVRAAHGQFHRPRQIAGIEPDVIAVKGKNTIIIEVKSKGSLGKSTRALNQLARYAKRKRNVRFDLFVANPPSSVRAKLAARARKKKKSARSPKRAR
jgi:Holliday junction resolvase